MLHRNAHKNGCFHTTFELCWEVTAVLLTEGVSVFTEASVTHEIFISGRGRGINMPSKVRTGDIHIFC